MPSMPVSQRATWVPPKGILLVLLLAPTILKLKLTQAMKITLNTRQASIHAQQPVLPSLFAVMELLVERLTEADYSNAYLADLRELECSWSVPYSQESSAPSEGTSTFFENLLGVSPKMITSSSEAESSEPTHHTGVAASTVYATCQGVPLQHRRATDDHTSCSCQTIVVFSTRSHHWCLLLQRAPSKAALCLAAASAVMLPCWRP